MKRPGYTLIEILLVLALLVLIAAVVMPAVLSGGAWSKLQDAGNDISSMWGRARLDAAAKGEVLLFRCELGGRTAQVRLLSSGVQDGATQSIQLHESLVFDSIAVGEPAGSELIGGQQGAVEASPVVVFRPDGTASDAELVLRHEEGRRLKVTLRGITGAIRLEDAEPEDS